MVARIFVICVFLAACQTTPVQGDFCRDNKPWRLSAERIEQMTDAEIDQMVRHNKRGQKLCGWRK